MGESGQRFEGQVGDFALLGAGNERDEALACDAVETCGRLIRFDTSNFGGGESRGERPAAEWVAAQLSDAGYDPVVVEAAPGRASTVVRIPGADPALPALLVHGHLDVVPAERADWSIDPFAGEIRDNAVWGRGALDMKGMDAMMLAVVRSWARSGTVPPRDVVLAFVADEEDAGCLGAGYLAGEGRDLLEGVTVAVGESGGELTVLPDGGHLYPVATAERGTARLVLTARGPAGHGSRPVAGNAVAVLAHTVATLAELEWPVRLVAPVRDLLQGLATRLDLDLDHLEDPAARAEVLAGLGEAGRLVRDTLSNTLSPTMLAAGYKANVIPSEATAVVDGRVLPGLEEEFLAAVDATLPPAVARNFQSRAAAVTAPAGAGEIAAMTAALRAHDPGAVVLPFCMSGGTDAKWFAPLGIACYGFTPGRDQPGSEGWRGVHGVDERVPVDSLAFGVRVLDTYLRTPPSTGCPPRPSPTEENP